MISGRRHILLTLTKNFWVTYLLQSVIYLGWPHLLLRSRDCSAVTAVRLNADYIGPQRFMVYRS
jgi:hypothetical protein